jgi:hypothetical protein
VVAHDDRFELGQQFLHHRLMRRMRQVRIAGGGTLKDHDEAVCEALVESLAADVRPPREIEDAGNLSREAFDQSPQPGDLRRRAGWFEFEEGDVFDSSWHTGGPPRILHKPRAGPKAMHIFPSLVPRFAPP